MAEFKLRLYFKKLSPYCKQLNYILKKRSGGHILKWYRLNIKKLKKMVSAVLENRGYPRWRPKPSSLAPRRFD